MTFMHWQGAGVGGLSPICALSQSKSPQGMSDCPEVGEAPATATVPLQQSARLLLSTDHQGAAPVLSFCPLVVSQFAFYPFIT